MFAASADPGKKPTVVSEYQGGLRGRIASMTSSGVDSKDDKDSLVEATNKSSRI